MYSDMSIRIMASSVSNRNALSALASSVFPTPVGPRKMKLPIGLLGSFIPDLARLTALETATMASCCPMMRPCSTSSIFSSFADSPSTSLETGMPVHE